MSVLPKSMRATSLVVALTAGLVASVAVAQDKPMNSGSSGSTSSGGSTPPAPPYAQILKDAKPVPGLLQLHQHGNNLFVELKGSDYGSEFIVLISIAAASARGSCSAA